MTRIDRYILALYSRTLLICFLSVAGLMVVVQIFTNLDEFMRYADKLETSLLEVLVDYFTPYVVMLFERLSGMLALLAMLFVIAWLNKTNEFTALLAAGVAKRRVVRPLMLASAFVVVSAVAIRELVIPKYQDQLDRQPQDLSGDLNRQLRPMYDDSTMVLIQGKHLLPVRAEIVQPNLRIHGGPIFDALGAKLTAQTATYRPATDELPAGYLIDSVLHPTTIDDLASIWDEQGQPLLLTSHDTEWLEQGECFLASEIEIEMLNGGSAWKQYASTVELVNHLRGENKLRSADIRVQIHQRLLRPLVDWTVLLLGIPVLLSRPDRHMFWVAGACLGIVAGFTSVVLGFAAIGNSATLLSPMLAVWLPVLIFLPWAWARTQQAFET